MPLTINTSSHASGTFQFVFTVPVFWDDFWTNVLSNGFDVVIVNQFGEAYTFERLATWHKANRVGVFRANYGTSKVANGIHTLFVYWDNEDETSDRSSSVVAASPSFNANVYLGAPFGNIVNAGTRSGLSTVPASVFQKDPDENIYIWYPVSQLLTPLQLPSNDHLDFAFFEYFEVEILNSSGTHQSAMNSLNELRIVNGWAAVRVTAGSNNTDYVVRLVVVDTLGQKFIQTSLLQVRKLLPS
jgi:hypothetical protein